MQNISIHDRGLQYGDGLFETIAVVNGRPQLWRRHMQRLLKGCERLLIPAPSEEAIQQQIAPLIANKPHCVLKIIVTRGAGGRGYKIPEIVVPTVLTYINDWPAYDSQFQESGVCLRVCDTPASRNSRLAGVKHLNRLENVLARAEWNDSNIQEGLLLDADANVIEGTMSNVFMVKDGIIKTPDLTEHGVAGVLREYILHIAETLGYEVQEGRMSLTQLCDADEIFLTNSIIGIWPVRLLDGRGLDTGESGNPVTRGLRAYLTDNIENEK